MARAKQARVRFGLASLYPSFFLLYISTIYREKFPSASVHIYIYMGWTILRWGTFLFTIYIHL